MYLPEAFKVEDPALLAAVMCRHSFATVISCLDGDLEATHLPLVHDQDRGSLLGHFARANPHWKHFESPCEALMIFQGPHAYVSPSMYATEPNVPTWAYVTVHARGIPRLLSDEEAVEQMVAMVRHFDPELSGASVEPGYVNSKVRGIRAFEMPIDRLEGKFKVGQNKTDTDRLSAGKVLAASDDEVVRQIGRMYLDGPSA